MQFFKLVAFNAFILIANTVSSMNQSIRPFPETTFYRLTKAISRPGYDTYELSENDILGNPVWELRPMTFLPCNIHCFSENFPNKHFIHFNPQNNPIHDPIEIDFLSSKFIKKLQRLLETDYIKIIVKVNEDCYQVMRIVTAPLKNNLDAPKNVENDESSDIEDNSEKENIADQDNVDKNNYEAMRIVTESIRNNLLPNNSNNTEKDKPSITDTRKGSEKEGTCDQDIIYKNNKEPDNKIEKGHTKLQKIVYISALFIVIASLLCWKYSVINVFN